MKIKRDNNIITKKEKENIKNLWNRIERVMVEKYHISKEKCTGAGLMHLIENNRKKEDETLGIPSYDFFNNLKNKESYKNEYCNIQLENLYMIANGLDVSADYLMGRSDNMDLTGTGLSQKAVNKLLNIKKKADNYDYRKCFQYYQDIKHANVFLNRKDRESNAIPQFFENPYAKRIKILNYIIENIDESNSGENFDFLVLLYWMVFLRLKKDETYKDDFDLIDYLKNELSCRSKDIGNEKYIEVDDVIYILKEIEERYRKAIHNVDIRSGVYKDDLTGDWIETENETGQEMINRLFQNIITGWQESEEKSYEQHVKKQKEKGRLDIGKAINMQGK